MALEDQIRAAHDRKDFERAATVALDGYGSEILGFLVAILRDEAVAREVFSAFCEDVWVGLPRFAWRSSFRTWAYCLARNAAQRHRRRPQERPGLHVPIEPYASALADRVWRTTRTELFSQVRDRVAALRDELDPEDQTLLILRIDRAMSWEDVAAAMAPPPDRAEEPAAHQPSTAALRKRFERIKVELRSRAIAAGLLPEGGSSQGGRERA